MGSQKLGIGQELFAVLIGSVSQQPSNLVQTWSRECCVPTIRDHPLRFSLHHIYAMYLPLATLISVTRPHFPSLPMALQWLNMDGPHSHSKTNKLRGNKIFCLFVVQLQRKLGKYGTGIKLCGDYIKFLFRRYYIIPLLVRKLWSTFEFFLQLNKYSVKTHIHLLSSAFISSHLWNSIMVCSS